MKMLIYFKPNSLNYLITLIELFEMIEDDPFQ
jgi:hypothetical protein